ncbi:MAG: winged helix-turn-helix domain-containing protein [Planctomycetota bacterium]
MAKKKLNLQPRFKLWISSSDDEGVFGDGKWRLLMAIEREGSLRAASEAMGISYRKAWGDLQKAERCLGTPLLERLRGGTGGGRTTLTAAGKQWIAAYGRFRRDLERAMKTTYEKHVAALAANQRSERRSKR